MEVVAYWSSLGQLFKAAVAHWAGKAGGPTSGEPSSAYAVRTKRQSGSTRLEKVVESLFENAVNIMFRVLMTASTDSASSPASATTSKMVRGVA